MVLRLFDRRFSIETKIHILISYIFLILSAFLFISALPRSESIILDIFGLIKINVGTELDIIRLLLGIALGYIGYKGIKLKW